MRSHPPHPLETRLSDADEAWEAMKTWLRCLSHRVKVVS
jgi:hypothetical protein